MPDLNDLLRRADRMPVPDLWPEIRDRHPRSPSGPSLGRRLLVAALALAVAGVGVAIVARGFLGGEPASQRGAVPSMGKLAVVVIEESYLGKGADSIYLVNQDGTGMERLLEGRAPAWSPDGTQITFRRGNPNRGGGLDTTIYTARADGTAVQIVATGVSGEASGESGQPVWSPDGTLIAFDTLGGIYVVAPDGSDLRRISRYEGDLACYDLQPSWSPDGTKLAFAVLCDGGNEGIWTVTLDGSERALLLAPTEDLVDLSQPVWSPDGTQIAFVGVTRTGSGGGDFQRDIWVMNADGTGSRRLTDGSAPVAEPAWSPDGTAIAYWVWRTERVMVMNADGSGQRPLTGPGIRACCPAWQPDARG